MDAPKHQKSDPAILLLNEIDILLAQTRLMDLYLKQAQATAANENARIHQQYESELATLRADLADKERQLQQRPVIAVERNLSETIDQLQRELSEKQQILSSQEVTFQRSTSEIAALQGRIAQLEADNSAAVSAARASNAIREGLAADVAALNQELERNRRELHQQQLAARQLENGLREQLQLLQNQVAEQQAYAFSADGELGKAQQEIAALHQHLGSLQALQDELQASAAQELEQARGRFESELASLLRSELENLDALHNQTKADAARDLAQGRDALESELSALRNELQQKAWSLAQHQASVENLAQIHREQMRKLEARVSEQQPVIEQQSRELEQALTRANALQRQVEELRAALQQTQAAGARQAEQIRQEYAARVETVNSLLAIKSAEMANSGAVRANVEESLRGELSRLRSEIQSRTAALRSREDELNRVRAEMTSVQNRLVQLESVSARTESEARAISQAKSGLESELTDLRNELQQGSSAVAHQQAAMDDLAARHRSQVEQLEANLSEQHRASEERRREVDQAQAQIALLHSRIEELQSALQQTKLSANSRTEQLRQEYAARVDALNRELGEHSARRQDRASANSDSEQALRSEIDRLIGEAQERNQILESRNDELVWVKNDLDSLAERFSQLESHAVHAESSASGDAESMRTGFQAQLALLQAELSQKEWALEERQAIIAGIEQEYRQQLDALRQQLAEEEQSAIPADNAFVMGDPNLTEAQREKLLKLDDMVKAIRSGDNVSVPAPSGRRWQSGFGWKRRWRS